MNIKKIAIGLMVLILALLFVSSGISQIQQLRKPLIPLELPDEVKLQRHWIARGSWKTSEEVGPIRIQIPRFRDIGLPPERLVPQVSIRSYAFGCYISWVKISGENLEIAIASSTNRRGCDAVITELNCSVSPVKMTN